MCILVKYLFAESMFGLSGLTNKIWNAHIWRETDGNNIHMCSLLHTHTTYNGILYRLCEHKTNIKSMFVIFVLRLIYSF